MTQEDKELLLKDLCARLPYGVKAQVYGWDEEKEIEVKMALKVYSFSTDGYVHFENNDYGVNYYRIDSCPLLLRPMSSMTEEEREYLQHHVNDDFVDYCNEHYLDYRGLISIGLALEAPEGMYENDDK